MVRSTAAGLILSLVLTVFIPTSYASPSLVRLVNGETHIGEVTLDKEEKKIVISMENQEITLTFDEIKPSSLFALMMREVDKEDEPGHFELAQFARRHQLFRSAIREFETVMDLDGDLKEDSETALAEVKREHQQALLDEVQAKMESKTWKSARKTVKELLKRYPDSAAAIIARAMKDEIEEAEAAAKAVDPAKYDKKQQRNLDIAAAMWKSANDREAKARELATDGLNYDSARLAARAQKALLESAELYEKVMDLQDEIKKHCDKYDYVKEEYYNNRDAGYDWKRSHKKTKNRVVDVLLNLSVSYMNSDMFEEATRACNRVLTLVEENREAMKLKVEIARRKSAKER